MRYYNIPIFVPHEGCPFDCSFCNQRRITGMDTSITKEQISEIIEEHLKTLPESGRYVEAAFFGGSFTGISPEKQCEFLETAYKYVKNKKIDGIRLSTRPDYISEEILDRLERYGVSAIELGVQSMDDEVLKASARGHDAKTVERAVSLIKKYPFKLGLQMMTGLPGDTDEKAVMTARRIIDLKPDFVRIYPTLVLSDTLLEGLYKNGEYTPQTISEAVNLCKKLLLMFRENNIDVIRVALVTTDEISDKGSVVAGPFHSAFRELVEGEIFYDQITAVLDKDSSVRTFCVNPRELSKAIGNGKVNLKKIKDKYGFDIEIKPMENIEKGKIKVWKE
ncbi:MAG: radical SAM protein [Clostridia bacterium]|nr:radical SAM protein [Clostridia bacterium]